MSETGRCPYCGSAPTPADRLEPVYREMRRIREIAEACAGDAGGQIAGLTREVEQLRAKVARLRAPRSVSLARRPPASLAAECPEGRVTCGAAELRQAVRQVPTPRSSR